MLYRYIVSILCVNYYIFGKNYIIADREFEEGEGGGGGEEKVLTKFRLPIVR